MKFLHPFKVSAIAAFIALAATTHAQLYQTNLSGPAESPPNASPGTGFANVYLNLVAHTFQVGVFFSGLIGPTSASHIHAATAVAFAGTAGVATQTPSFNGFPLGVTSGSYAMLFDMTQSSTWNPSFVSANGGTPAGAEAAFVAAIQAGKAYFNIHTSAFPGGEIRGFLVLATPESGTTLSLMAIALGGLALTAHRLGRAS